MLANGTCVIFKLSHCWPWYLIMAYMSVRIYKRARMVSSSSILLIPTSQSSYKTHEINTSDFCELIITITHSNDR